MANSQRPRIQKKEWALFAAPLLVVLGVLIGPHGKSFFDSLLTQLQNPPPPKTQPERPAGISTVAFSPDEKQLVTGDEKGAIKVWNIHTGIVQRVLQQKGRWVTAVAFSPDGHMIAAAGGASVSLWNLATGKKTIIKNAYRTAGHLAFTPEGRLLATTSCTGKVYKGIGVIELWDVATGKRMGSLDGKVSSIGHFDISPDGKRLAASCGRIKTSPSKPVASNRVQLWDLESKTLLWDVEGGTAWADVSFSPDGKAVASGGSTVRLLSSQTGKALKPPFVTYKGHSSHYRVVMSPRGKFLFGGTLGGPLVAWDVSSGLRVALENLSGLRANSLTVSHSGKYLANGSPRGIVEIWDLGRLNQLEPSRLDIASMDVFEPYAKLDTSKGQFTKFKTISNVPSP